jgi:hypothetical protein
LTADRTRPRSAPKATAWTISNEGEQEMDDEFSKLSAEDQAKLALLE